MKILILRNNITDTNTLDQGIVLAKQWALTIGLDLEFTLQDTTRQFTTYPYSNSAVGDTAGVQPSEILAEAPIGHDVVCLVYDWLKVTGPQPKNPSDALEIVNGENPMQIPCQWFSTFPEVFAAFFLHELCHMESFKNHKDDITHLLTDGKLQAENLVLYKIFSTQPNKNWYLYLLNGLINVPQETDLPPDSPLFMFNRDTGVLNPLYKGLQGPQTNAIQPTMQQSTVDLITQFEGLSLVPYQDQGGQWTIGYGTIEDLNGNSVTATTPPVTKDDAIQLFMRELQKYATAVTNTIKIILTQNQWDACVSLCYNIGVNGFEQSTVARECNASNFPAAAQAFLLWDKVKGVVSQGLLNRRNIEMQLFLK